MRGLMKRRGQGVTEYLVILALVAIAIIGIVATFGDDIRQMFESSSATAPTVTNSAKPSKAATDGGGEAPGR